MSELKGGDYWEVRDSPAACGSNALQEWYQATFATFAARDRIGHLVPLPELRDSPAQFVNRKAKHWSIAHLETLL